jgi:hypothetical protein
MLKNADELHDWVRRHTAINLPRKAVCDNHCAPFDYLHHAYFEPTSDCVIWAPRGGGKTRLGALATLLDLLFKPGVSVRILGGSMDQSLKMWEHLLPDLQEHFPCLNLREGCRRVRLADGGTAAVLTQSQRAVRGVRVQKLRCDEVELFKPAIWEAAQLTTRSVATGEGVVAAGVVEAFSTLHVSGGLMSEIVAAADARGTRVFRWCVMEVLARCEPDRPCEGCPLWAECQGKAKTACEGFLSVDDAIRLKSRVSRETWEAEMLCLRPSVRGRVFPHFKEEVHVCEDAELAARLPMEVRGLQPVLSLAMDFGFANPFVCLWVMRYGQGAAAVTYVLDEHVQKGWTMEEHIAHIASRRWARARQVFCDPAGTHANDQTARSNVDLLRGADYVVKQKHSAINEGIELLRLAVAPAVGEPRLFIHPRCRELITAMKSYRYPERLKGELPLKDGKYDHPIDALRYYFIHQVPAKVWEKGY